MADKMKDTEYAFCKKHGNLPIENFHKHALKQRRRECAKCRNKKLKKNNEAMYNRVNKKNYVRAKNIIQKNKKQNYIFSDSVSQNDVYEILERCDGKCPLTGRTRGCQLSRWRTSEWKRDNMVFLYKAYAEALESAIKTRDKYNGQNYVDYSIVITRHILSKNKQSGSDDITSHLAPWVLDEQNPSEIPTNVDDVPSLIFNAEAVRKIDDTFTAVDAD